MYELDSWPWDLDTDFTLGGCLFGGVKLAKNTDPNKYSCSGYGIWFNTCIEYSLPGDSAGKNVIILGAGRSWSVHINNKGKDILILSKGPTQGLNNTTLTAETLYPVNFTRPGITVCSSQHYNGSNSFVFDVTKIYQFKAKDSEIKKYPLCLANTSGIFQLITW